MKPAATPADPAALPELAPDAAEQAYARLLQALRQPDTTGMNAD
jgi:hypothetical protein